MQLYIKHLFLERLNKQNLDKVVQLIEKLPWHEEEEFIMKIILLLITNQAKFNEMDTIAILLASLKENHKPFVVRVMDLIFEEITRLGERNDFKEA